MITFACVLKSGGVYDSAWVRKLHAQVQLHCSRDFRFVCFTDMEFEFPGIERIELVEDWRGWWSKLEIFRPGVLSGTVIYMDLDCLIVGALDGFDRSHGFWMVPDFYNPVANFNSSVMVFQGGTQSDLYFAMKINPGMIMHLYDKVRPNGMIGDQAFIQTELGKTNHKVELLPSHEIVSYKRHCSNGHPEEASVVCFHGRPKMNHAADWAKEYWEGL